MTRSTLRSFAFGVILSTSMIGLFLYLNPKDNQPSMNELNDENVKEYVENQGKVIISKKTYHLLLSLQERLNKEGQAPEQSLKSEELPSYENNIKNQHTMEKTSKKEQDNHLNNKNRQIISYTLVVEKGMNSIEIAELLEEKQIINDADLFEQYLNENNLSRYIQIGTYQLNNSMSFEELGKTITKR